MANKTLQLKLVIGHAVIVEESVLFTDSDEITRVEQDLVVCAATILQGSSFNLRIEGDEGKIVSLSNVTGITYKWTDQPDTGARRGLPQID